MQMKQRRRCFVSFDTQGSRYDLITQNMEQHFFNKKTQKNLQINNHKDTLKNCH